MTEEKIIQDMIALLEEVAILWDLSGIDRSTCLKSDLNLDSLDHIEMMIGIEELYNITIDHEDFKSCKTFGCLVDLVQKYLKEK